MAGPLDQFAIHTITPTEVGGLDVSFTNASLWMMITVAVTSCFVLLGMRGQMVPGRWQCLVEAAYTLVSGMIKSHVGDEGRRYFPFVFTLFFFILFANLLGLLPYSFTVTSHIIVTFVMAFSVFMGVTLVGLVKHGFHFFSFFVPKGVPVFMYPLMIPIEIISYLSRPISLGVRLFANMMAGHTMIKVFASFVFALGSASYGLGGVAPIVMNVALVGFEVLVAFLQAYVFCVLTCLYLNDALHLH